MAEIERQERAALGLYRLLLRAFPPDFRQFYGPDLEATFLDQLRDRAPTSIPSRCLFWFSTVWDLLAEGLKERLARWTGQSRSPQPRRPLRETSPNSLGAFLETIRIEFRLAARSLLRRPGYAGTVILILGGGLGGATVAWATVHDVVLRPLGFSGEDRLVGVWMKNRLPDGSVIPRFPVSDAQIAALRDRAESVEDLAWVNMATGNGTVLRREGFAPQRIRYAPVSPNFFSFLGVSALRGRVLVPDDVDRDVVVLSNEAWTRHFGRDPGLVGRTIKLGSGTYRVVGILPKDFRWLAFPEPVEVWMPRRLEESRATPFFFNVVARPVAGAGPRQVQAEASGILLGVMNEVRPLDDPPEPFATVVPLREAHLGEVGPQLKTFAGAVAFVLALALLNVTLLLLIRVAGRVRESAVRAALGGGPARLAAPILSETLLLTGGAWLLGMVLAAAGLAGLRFFAPPGIQRVGLVDFSWDVLVAGAGVAAVSVLFVAGLPVLLVRTTSVRALLSSVVTPVGEGGLPRVLRAPLVVTEVALAVVLLSGAVLMLRSFHEYRSAELGFSTDDILQGQLRLPVEPYWTEVQGRGQPGDLPMLRIAPDLADRRRDLKARLASHPAVSEVALAQHTPLSGRYGGFTPFVREGREEREMPPGETWISSNAVDPDFLPFMGVELLSGRWLTEGDDASAPPVALVSAALARRYWLEEDPIGDRFRTAVWVPDGEGGYEQGHEWVTVVGVVRSLREWEFRRRDETVYRPLAQAYATGRAVLRATRAPQLSLFVRYRGEPATVSGHLRSTVARTFPGVPVDELKTMEEVAAGWLREPRFYAMLLTAFGLLAAILAAGGIAAVIGFGISRRTRELGLRIALGASRREVLGLVTGETLALVTIGVAAGAAASMVATRILEGLLFRVEAGDPLLIGVTAALFAAVAMLASWLPARTALSLDPADALRYE